MLAESIDKNNLHHAYLIEGSREEIVPELLKVLKSFGVKTGGNPDFVSITIDNFKIDEAFDLRAMSADKSFSESKKIFLICANSFSLDAQNVLLKMFEEPKENTYFFVIVPDATMLLKTLISRFYFISTPQNVNEEIKQAEKFIKMPLAARIEFIKNLLAEVEEKDEEGNEIIALDSNRAKALKFLNALEFALHRVPLCKNTGEPCAKIFEHIFKVREYLRMSGSSTKMLMESVALIVT